MLNAETSQQTRWSERHRAYNRQYMRDRYHSDPEFRQRNLVENLTADQLEKRRASNTARQRKRRAAMKAATIAAE